MARKKRHATLADGLRAWRDRPEGPIVPVKTNWRVAQARDIDAAEIADMPVERSWRMTPSTKEIMASVATGETEHNEAGQVVRIGKLRFSDGNQTERAYTHGPDGKLVGYDARLPAGAMIGTRDKPDGMLGGNDNPQETSNSNGYFAASLGTAPHRYKPGTTRRNGKSITADESRAVLAAAWKNTDPASVTYTYGNAALPCGSSKVADSFLGMRVACGKGSGGTTSWADMLSSMVSRDVWAETVAELSKRDITALDAAMTAKSVAQVGTSLGFGAEYSRRRGGMRALIAANDNFRKAYREAA